MGLPKVFVVVLNWNLKDDTIACIESVLASSYKPASVIVVDNGSLDGSAAYIADHFGKSIDLIVNETNMGFAAGVNVGIRHALAHNADWILLLNNDAIIAPDMIEQLMAVADCRPDIGILGPAIFYYDQPDRVWRLGDRHPGWSPIPFKISERVLRKGNEILPVDYVTGCGMLIRRQVFSSIGLFDPSYFMYYEDADFCRRAKQAGFSIVCVPAAKMWHKISGSTRTNISYQYYLKTRSRVHFYRRHYSLLALGYLILYIIWTILAYTFKGDGKVIRACIKGFYHGWRIGRDKEPTEVNNGNSRL
ncbi:MAG: glycosyltransferase family 2 protein [Candidatus Methanomethylicaceae archaeon]